MALVLVLLADARGWLAGFEQSLDDLAIRWLFPLSFNDIVIIDIDESSLRRLGPWPWSRQQHARLLHRLARARTGPVVFDLLFADRSVSDLEADDAFAEAIARHGKVVLAMTLELDGRGRPVEVLPHRKFADAAAAIGHTVLIYPKDQPLRWVSLMGGIDLARWPILALASSYLKQGYDRFIDTLPPRVEQQNGWKHAYPYRFSFPSGDNVFPRYSYSDVLEGRVDANLLSGKTLFIGVSVPELRHSYPLPLNAGQPVIGMEVHARVLASLQQSLLIKKMIGWPRILWLLLATLAAVLLYKVLGHRSPFLGLSLAFGMLLTVALLLLFLWQILVPVLSPMLGLLTGFAGMALLHRDTRENHGQ